MTTSTTDENWQEVQVKTFTNWINSKLKLNGYPLITDLFTDISDGTVVINLIHCITGILLDHNQAPSTKYQCLENHQFVIQFLEENKVQVVNIRPSDLVDGNEKLTLGLIWIVILKFGITGMIEENSNAKKALLAWCKAVTQPYHNVNVKDFSQSWKDGLAFNAIIHRFRPDLIGNFSDLDSKNAKFNVNKAFEVAESKLGIPKLMDAEDITEAIRPDEKSIFTYVSEYYNKFSTFENELSTKNKMSELIKLINWSINARNDYESKAVSFLQMLQAFKESTSEFEEELNKLVTKIVTVSELAKLLNDEFLSIKGLKGNIDLVHKIYNFKKFEVPENISLEKLDKGVFTTQITQFKNYSFLLKLLKKEENLEKEISEVKELKNEFGMKENFNSQINELSQKLTDISLKSNNLLKNPQLVINEKLKLLLDLQINVKKREDFLKRASDLFKQYDKNKKNKIIIDDFIKCLNTLGCFVGQSLEKKINDESSNYFTYDEYMSIMNNYTITNTTSVQFKKELNVLGYDESITPSFFGLSKEECGNIMNNGKIDIKKISEELGNE